MLVHVFSTRIFIACIRVGALQSSSLSLTYTYIKTLVLVLPKFGLRKQDSKIGMEPRRNARLAFASLKV